MTHFIKNINSGIDKLRDSVNFENEIRHLSENFGDFIAVLDKPDSCGRRVIICRENVIKESLYSYQMDDIHESYSIISLNINDQDKCNS